jgi:hypothetical protein
MTDITFSMNESSAQELVETMTSVFEDKLVSSLSDVVKEAAIEDMDYDLICDRVVDQIDFYELQSRVIEDLDYDEIQDTVHRNLDHSRVAEEVTEHLDYDEISNQVGESMGSTITDLNIRMNDLELIIANLRNENQALDKIVTELRKRPSFWRKITGG